MTRERWLDKFCWNPGDVEVSLCVTCTRFRSAIVPTCAAYPEGIPVAILDGSWDHRTPQPGDHGLVYEPAEAQRE